MPARKQDWLEEESACFADRRENADIRGGVFS
jgi:hypothetical protein